MTLKSIETALREAGVEDASFEARCLAAHFTGRSMASLLASPADDLLSPGLEAALDRRVRREPLQYILGTWEFMGLPFFVSPDCLIPRADTETLVENALLHLPKNARAADLCTGSGCIGISLAHFRPDVAVTAVELSEVAARMAERNARALGVADRFRVIRGDVTGAVFAPDETFDMIVSNPPYIACNEMSGLAPELSYEPRMALTDEGDGLSVIRGVLRTARRHLTPEGVVLMEFGAAQGSAVSAIAEEYNLQGEILQDAGGRDRVLLARRIS